MLYFFRKGPISYAVLLSTKMKDMSLMGTLKHYRHRRERENHFHILYFCYISSMYILIIWQNLKTIYMLKGIKEVSPIISPLWKLISMHTNHSPGRSYVLEPVDLPSSRNWQSDFHRAGGRRASLPPSQHLLPQHSHPDSVLQYISQIHGEAKVTPSAL